MLVQNGIAYTCDVYAQPKQQGMDCLTSEGGMTKYGCTRPSSPSRRKKGKNCN